MLAAAFSTSIFQFLAAFSMSACVISPGLWRSFGSSHPQFMHILTLGLLSLFWTNPLYLTITRREREHGRSLPGVVHQSVVHMQANRQIEVEGLATGLFVRLRLNAKETPAIQAPGTTRGSRTLGYIGRKSVLSDVGILRWRGLLRWHRQR